MERSIDAHTDEVFARVQVIGHGISLRQVSALGVSHIEPVDPNTRIAEDTLEDKAIRGGIIDRIECNDLAIPPYTILGIGIANRLVAMAMAGFGIVRERCCPIVRDLYHLPSGVIERKSIRSLVMDTVRFGEVVKIFGPAAKVLLRIGSVSQCKTPIGVEVDNC